MTAKMLCGKCKGGVEFEIKGNVEAYCWKCGTFLGIAGRIKDLIKYRKSL